jgi:hypothetical protein
MRYKLLSEVTLIETIAVGSGIRNRTKLRRKYGPGHWRKMKGIARIELEDGSQWLSELHWYEAHGIGRRHVTVKYLLEQIA